MGDRSGLRTSGGSLSQRKQDEGLDTEDALLAKHPEAGQKYVIDFTMVRGESSALIHRV
jgi:hypothetical protein